MLFIPTAQKSTYNKHRSECESKLFYARDKRDKYIFETNFVGNKCNQKKHSGFGKSI